MVFSPIRKVKLQVLLRNRTSQVVSGTLASGILTLLTYAPKSVLTQYMLRSDSKEGSDESNEYPLQINANGTRNTMGPLCCEHLLHCVAHGKRRSTVLTTRRMNASTMLQG